MNRKLGKTPARPGAISLKFGAFFSADTLPTPPRRFGHFGAITQWGAFANDKYADCVFAGAAHETMVWLSEAGESAAFNDQCVLSDYAALTGFNPGDSSSDQGTDMQEAASYRRKTGIVDASGVRHTVDAYVALNPGDIDQLALAAYLFGAVGVGLMLPGSAEDQFDRGQPWDVVDGARPEGGHYVPVIGRNSAGNFLVITWGRLHAMTPAFVVRYMDEGVAYLSLEALKNHASPEGIALEQLQKDLAAIAAKPRGYAMSNTDQAPAKPEGTEIDEGEVQAVFIAMRADADASGYGHWISDDKVRKSATDAVVASMKYRNAPAL